MRPASLIFKTSIFLVLGAAKEDSQEACRLSGGGGGSAGHEGRLLQHQ